MNSTVHPAAVPLRELVERFGGVMRGDLERAVTGVATLESASPESVSFLANPRYRSVLSTTRAAAVIVSAEEADAATDSGAVFWVADNPYAHFARVAQFFAARATPTDAPGIHPSAIVDGSAEVAAGAHIGPGTIIEAEVRIGGGTVVGPACVIGAGSRVGPGSRLHARVTIYPRCVVGPRAVIHSGAVIGADGFGFARDGASWIKIPQTGRVVIGADVEIGANTTIDRGALDDTEIGDGVKLDNQIQIGHNCRIGAHTVIAGCTGIAGSTTLGERCMIGGAAMILGHLTLADDTSISVATVVSHSITKPGLYTGFYPMAENASWEKNAALIRHLGRLRERVRALEQLLPQTKGRA
jgi:UDP-3-O-[3-hydroxymyristoyl] glucosamine N-acyltransferase